MLPRSKEGSTARSVSISARTRQNRSRCRSLRKFRQCKQDATADRSRSRRGSRPARTRLGIPSVPSGTRERKFEEDSRKARQAREGRKKRSKHKDTNPNQRGAKQLRLGSKFLSAMCSLCSLWLLKISSVSLRPWRAWRALRELSCLDSTGRPRHFPPLSSLNARRACLSGRVVGAGAARRASSRRRSRAAMLSAVST
jgi:hypothetical protein